MVVTSPEMTIDEEEIFLPNTTKYLEQLRIKHAQQRCVLDVPKDGEEGEYDPLPVSPNKLSRNKLTQIDEVKVIRGPRERARRMNASAIRRDNDKASRRDDDNVMSFDVEVRRDQDESSLVSKRQDDSESIMRMRQDPMLRKNKYGFRESGEANSILNKIKLRRQERENERRLRELAEIDAESSTEDDFSAVGGGGEDDNASVPQIKAVVQVVSDLSFVSIQDEEEASTKRRKVINNRLSCGLMSLLLDDDEIKEMREMGRYSSPRMGVTAPCGADDTDDWDEMQEIGRFSRPIRTSLISPSDDGNDDDDDVVEKRQDAEQSAGLKTTVTSPSGGGNHYAVEKVQEIVQFASPEMTVTSPSVASPSGGDNHADVDNKQETGANNDGYMASCGTANGDGTSTDKEQEGLSCAETNTKNESACISAVRLQVEATHDFFSKRLLCEADDVPTSGEDDEVVKEDTDTSGGQWIDTVKQVVKKETKPEMLWLDNVSSSDSIVVEEKKEGSEVALAMKARCTDFASMLLIEKEELVVLEKYSCW
jgi:hypothetical protein